MAPTALRPVPADSTELEAWQAAVLVELRAIRAAVERQQRPEAHSHREALPPMLASAVADKAFSAREVIAHAERVDSDSARELRLALARAGLSTARKLGKWFKTIEGETIAGVRLERLGLDRDGVIWRVSRVSHSQTHTGHGLVGAGRA